MDNETMLRVCNVMSVLLSITIGIGHRSRGLIALVMEKMKDIQYTHPSDSDRI